MTAKEYLLSIHWMEKQIEYERRELEHWRELSMSVQAVNYEPRYGSNKPVDAPFVKCLEKKAEAEEKIKHDTERLVHRKLDIIDKLRKIDDVDCKSVLEMRYLSYFTWEEISEVLHYSIRWIYKLHGHALVKFEKLMEEDC